MKGQLISNSRRHFPNSYIIWSENTIFMSDKQREGKFPEIHYLKIWRVDIIFISDTPKCQIARDTVLSRLLLYRLSHICICMLCIHNMIILYRLILKEIKTTHKLPFMPLEHSKYITEFRNYPTLIVSKVG